MTATTIVIATRNRAATLLDTLRRLAALPDAAPIVVVDNASVDGSPQAVRRAYPATTVIALDTNHGAAARTLGVRAARTPYIAFCDDDCWWAPGALSRASALLDAHPEVGLLNARVLACDDEHLDPACRVMSESAVPKRSACPGTAIAAFMAGAAVMRRRAFLYAGGYHERFLIGAEESLLAIDLLQAGWELVYAPELILYHHPCPEARDPLLRRRLVLRNRLWTSWLRHSVPRALRATAALACHAAHDAVARAALRDAVSGWRWIAAERRRIAPRIERLLEHVAEPPT